MQSQASIANLRKMPLPNDSEQFLSTLLKSNAKNPESLQLFGQQKLNSFTQFIEKKIYQQLIQKALNQNFRKIMVLHKVTSKAEEFHLEDLKQDLNNCVKTQLDTLQVWIRFNIIERKQVLDFKRQVLQIQQRKIKKLAEIDELIQKIAQKYNHNKVDEILKKFIQARKANEIKYVPNQEVLAEYKKLKRIMERGKTEQERQFIKAEEQIKNYELTLQKETGIVFSRLDSLLI